uniref:Meiosis-specific protein MEI4 n=1 Tax=Monopterus albus TaxID=43700 RepID=A0A3Q3QJP8_MONAL|nr:meiosis-specific protein MEI4 isoform X3 [Monopterus albus]
MQSEQGLSKGASQAKWFLMRAQLALAVAVIKSTPPGASGREHAEALSRELKSQDESWKQKAQGLQQEVLRLRQEMLIIRVTSEAKSSAVAADHDTTVDNVSEDLFGSGSVVHSADLQLLSDSETPELFERDPQPAIASPQPPVPCSFPARPWGKPVAPHVHFLQSLCALHRVAGNGRGLDALWFSPDGDTRSVLVDSVCQLLDSVVTACRDPPPLGPCDFVQQACQVAAQAMDLICSRRLASVELMRCVEESLKELTGMLLHSNQSSGGQEDSRLDGFPLDQYQNSCHLFWVLEELLQKSKVPCRVEVGSEQMGFLRHVEQRLFLLSDEFPLFSIYMWRIGGLLTSSDKITPSAGDQVVFKERTTAVDPPLENHALFLGAFERKTPNASY